MTVASVVDAMSLPDHMLEEPPDPAWCEEHACPHPCMACEADEADRQYDARKDFGHETV